MPINGYVNLKSLLNIKLNQLNPIVMPEYLFFQNHDATRENLKYKLDGLEKIIFKNQDMELIYELK